MNAIVRRKKIKNSIPVEFRDLPSTSERLAKADGFIDVGDDKQGARIYTFKDSPIERMFARKAIDPIEYTALQRYKHHWYHGGLLPAVGSVDLNRVFASDTSNMSGMAKSERQAHHRQQYREARELVGHRVGIVVDNVVCAEWTLEIAGYSIGYNSPYRARRAASEVLCGAGRALAKFWGIG